MARAAGSWDAGGDLAMLGGRPLGPQDPAMVGRYRIHALLGNGGMGRVYLGSAHGSADSHTWAAVKVIRPDLADDPEFRRRFARELEAVGRVSTPYAAALLHGEPDAQQPWMATEFVPGIALAAAVAAGNPLPEPAVWRLAHDLGHALTAVHRTGLVHRDVKPANVILATTGAKIIDFGVAHAADLSQLTVTGMSLGTPGYMAPEQAKAGVVSPASDVFSLGALLYFAATARLPYGVGGTAEVLFRIVYEEPDTSPLDALDHGLRELILRCLAKEPLQRPNAAGVVATAENAASAGAWSPAPDSIWPQALSAGIWERAQAAGRTLPDNLPHATATATAATAAEAGPGAGAMPPEPAAHQQDPYSVPPIPAADGVPTIYTPAVDGRSGGFPAGDPLRADREKRKSRGVLTAVASAAVVLALGLTAFGLWGTGSSSTGGAASAADEGTVRTLPSASSTGGVLPAAPGAPTSAYTPTASGSAKTQVSKSSTAGATGGGGVATSAGPAQQTSAKATSAPPTTVTSTTAAGVPNKYTPTEACGSGFTTIDHHALSGATIYLLYNSSTGYNCVVTMATSVSGAVYMNATLSVQGGSSGSNPGNFTYYAGPVKEHAPSACVEWGGTYKSSSWTSGWSHCN